MSKHRHRVATMVLPFGRLQCRPEKKNHLALASFLFLLLAAILLSKQPFQSARLRFHTHPSDSEPPLPYSPKAAIFPDGSPLSSQLAPSGSHGPQDASFFAVGSPSPFPEPTLSIAPTPQAAISETGSRPSPPLAPQAAILGKGTGWDKRRSYGKCDLYDGRWVSDVDGRYPLYSPGSCPFVDSKFACKENGRRDGEYLKWRWKPNGCDLPRFNATDFLGLLRGKVLMFVGDSLSRNQYESMQCLLREALLGTDDINGTKGYTMTQDHGYFRMQFLDYNCSVEYHRSYYLVRRGSRLDGAGKSWPTLQIDRIDDFADHWKTADILIFNTGHWWTRFKTNGGKYFYQEGSTVYPNLSVIQAYRRALQTWASWVEKNLKSQGKTVFLRGLGNSHFSGGSWDYGGRCDKETMPTLEGRLRRKSPWQMKVINEVVRKTQFPIKLLNVTRLTNFRKDAHPSIYGEASVSAGWNSSRAQDCSHWCLPGLPDTWNELLYANLL